MKINQFFIKTSPMGICSTLKSSTSISITNYTFTQKFVQIKLFLNGEEFAYFFIEISFHKCLFELDFSVGQVLFFFDFLFRSSSCCSVSRSGTPKDQFYPNYPMMIVSSSRYRKSPNYNIIFCKRTNDVQLL